MKKILLIAAMLISVTSFAQIQSASLTASGLTCSMCSKAIYKALLKVPSIQKVDVDIEKSSYTILFKPNAQIFPDALKKAVEGAGFAIAQLRFTAKLPKTVHATETKLTLDGAKYRFIRPTGKTIEGLQSFTVVDKSYLSPGDWKRYAKDMPTAKELDMYFVTL